MSLHTGMALAKKASTHNADAFGKILLNSHSHRKPDVYRVVGFTPKMAIIESVPFVSQSYRGGGSGRIDVEWLQKNPLPVFSLKKTPPGPFFRVKLDSDENGFSCNTPGETGYQSLLFEVDAFGDDLNSTHTWCEY